MKINEKIVVNDNIEEIIEEVIKTDNNWDDEYDNIHGDLIIH